VLAGVSDTLLRRLQSVLNAAARLVFSARKSEHITPLLCELHWLRVPKRIKFPTMCSGFPMSSWYSATVYIDSVLFIVKLIKLLFFPLVLLPDYYILRES